jgi:hypothetical protein
MLIYFILRPRRFASLASPLPCRGGLKIVSAKLRVGEKNVSRKSDFKQCASIATALTYVSANDHHPT